MPLEGTMRAAEKTDEGQRRKPDRVHPGKVGAGPGLGSAGGARLGQRDVIKGKLPHWVIW